jgi:5-methylcytosine-specific restriction endonuclease McrA
MRTTGGNRAKAARALIMRRTYSMFRHMAERADKAVASVPFSLEELRSYATDRVACCCPYCSDPLRPRTFSLDHRIPIERGGSWDLDNLDVICDPCNRAKGTMTGSEFESVLRVLREMPGPTMRDVLGRLKAGANLPLLRIMRRKKAA